MAGPFAKFIFRYALTDGFIAVLKFKKWIEINSCIKNPKAFPLRIKNPKSIPLLLIKEISKRRLWIFTSMTTNSTIKFLASDKNNLQHVTFFQKRYDLLNAFLFVSLFIY